MGSPHHLWQDFRHKNREFYSARNSEKQKTDIAKLPTGGEIKINVEKYDNWGLISKSQQWFVWLLDTPAFLQGWECQGKTSRAKSPDSVRSHCEAGSPGPALRSPEEGARASWGWPGDPQSSSAWNRRATAEPAGNSSFQWSVSLGFHKDTFTLTLWVTMNLNYSAKNGFVTSLHHSCHQIKNHKKNDFVLQLWPAGFFHCSYCRILTWPRANNIFQPCSLIMCCAFPVSNLKYAEYSELQLQIKGCWSPEQKKYC